MKKIRKVKSRKKKEKERILRALTEWDEEFLRMRLGKLAEKDSRLFKIQIHKIRVNEQALDPTIRAESRAWLIEEGFDEYKEIRPPAEEAS